MTRAAAPTPPMGWNSWNRYRVAIDEDLIIANAQAMVASGMQAAGYRYVVIDDGWQAPYRGRDGHLVPDPDRFGGGIAAIADEVHAMGLKLGLYASPGYQTCAMLYDNYTGLELGSFGHELDDITDFADWGIDYLKYDWCQADLGNTGLDFHSAFETMSRHIDSLDREIVYSISEYGRSKPWEWAGQIANSWRTTNDIEKSFDSVMGIARAQKGIEQFGGPGHWNDPDMLQVGNAGLSLAECRTHFALWAILASPLMAGNDLALMDDEIRDLLCHRGVLAISQDPLGVQGGQVLATDSFEVYQRPLSHDRLAIGVVNLSGDELGVALDASGLLVEAPGGVVHHQLSLDAATAVDVWRGAPATAASVADHDIALFVAGTR